MPNWCYNKLTVRGNKNDIKAFLERSRATDKDNVVLDNKYSILQGHYPRPPELNGIQTGFRKDENGKEHRIWRGQDALDSDYDEKNDTFFTDEEIEELKKKTNGFTNWYDWCIAHWGTKWGDCDTELIDQDEENLLFRFETAWSPPEAAIDQIARDWPYLIFYLTYEEEGMGFEGFAKWINGEWHSGESYDSPGYVGDEFGYDWKEEYKEVVGKLPMLEATNEGE